MTENEYTPDEIKARENNGCLWHLILLVIGTAAWLYVVYKIIYK